VDQFRVFRAIGLAFKAWFANFIPITLLAAVLYAPAVIAAATMHGDAGELTANDMEGFAHVIWLVAGGSALVAPFLTYRVIQHMNGAKASILSSVTHGFRGIIPVLIIAIVNAGLGMLPGGFGGFISIFVNCYWFVAGPAAVVERLGPFAALSRSATLTNGRRGGIFGLCLVIGLSLVVIMIVVFAPMFSRHATAEEFKHMVIVVVPIICIYNMFNGIVQAVSYSLLRADKDGVSNEELAKVFE
jgi:hypothetical protein